MKKQKIKLNTSVDVAAWDVIQSARELCDQCSDPDKLKRADLPAYIAALCDRVEDLERAEAKARSSARPAEFHLPPVKQ